MSDARFSIMSPETEIRRACLLSLPFSTPLCLPDETYCLVFIIMYRVIDYQIAFVSHSDAFRNANRQTLHEHARGRETYSHRLITPSDMVDPVSTRS